MEYFKHESSYVDEGCQIGNGTKIWHFSHIMSNCTIGENYNIGQNDLYKLWVMIFYEKKNTYFCNFNFIVVCYC